jgi:general secretion pathway protein D
MHRTKLTIVMFAIAALLLAGNCPAQAVVSARRALDLALPNVNLDNVLLSDAIDFLRDVSGANVHVNWRALEAAGVGKDTQVNVRLRTVTLRKVLDLVLGEAGAGVALAYYVDQGVIEITTRELADKDLFTRVYPIQDLIVEVPDFIGPDFNITQNNTQTSGSGGGGGGGGSGQGLFGGGSSGTSGTNGQEKQMTRAERAQALIDVITETIQPEIWNTNGGPAAIRFFNGNLIVTAPRSVHEALGGIVD